MKKANKRTVHLDNEKIREQYLKGATLAVLAEEYGVSTGTIEKRISNIKRKTAYELLPEREVLIEELKAEGGMGAVAEKYGVSYSSVSSYCKKNNISITGELRKKRKKTELKHNKEIASDYLSGIPVSKLQEKYGLSRQGIYNRLTKEGVERRGQPVVEGLKEEELIQDISEDLSLGEIAEKHGVCSATVRRYLKKYGLEVRRHSNSLGLNSALIIEKYESGKSLTELAQEYGASTMTIRRYILAGGGKTRHSGRKS